MLPLSNLSSVAKDSLSTIVNKDKSIVLPTSINSIRSYSGDEYRQCRRIRNIAIANQQKRNPNHYLSSPDNRNPSNQTTNNRSRQNLSRFWRAVRLLQLNFRHRRSASLYAQQINTPQIDEHPTITTSTVTATSLDTIGENENIYHRANLEVAEPVYNELPATLPIVPSPAFISFSNNDQDDEQDATPAIGQTLCKLFLKKFFHSLLFFLLVHIAAKLPGHEDVVRILMGENTNMTSLVNSNGQIPLLCAIQAGSTLTGE
jgi:hypothetical protein